MASPRRLAATRKGGLLDGGAVAAFAEACIGGGAAVARGGSPGGLLAWIFEMARKVSGGIGGGAAPRFAADSGRLLRSGVDGAPWRIGEIVEHVVPAWVGGYASLAS